MRTFAHFPADDRENRLIGFDGSNSPSSVPEAVDVPAPPPESADIPVDTPEAVTDIATDMVNTGNVDMNEVTAAVSDMEIPDVTEDPSVEEAGADLLNNITMIDDTSLTTGESAQTAEEQSSETTLDDYEARDIENSQKDDLETSADTAPAVTTEASESTETPAQKYEAEKTTQLLNREDMKLSDVRENGNPNGWSTINSGKTDGTGKPFLYKEGTRTVNGEAQPVLLAYSPDGGLQVMDTKTHEWKMIGSMNAEERSQITGTEDMTKEAHSSVLAAEKEVDGEDFQKRMEQNQRNYAMEEDCLKNKTADATWFMQNDGAEFWKGNEDVYEALAATIAAPAGEQTSEEPNIATNATNVLRTTPTNTADTTVAEEPDTEDETVSDQQETTEENQEQNPEVTALRKQVEELTKAVATLTTRLDALEGKTTDAATTEEQKEEEKSDVEKDGAEKGSEENDTEKKDAEKKDEAVAEAEKILENPDATAAERTDAVKTLTDAALDELESQKADASETPKEAATDTPASNADVKNAAEVKESDLDDKQLRAKLIGEVRNEPRTSVAEVKSAKADAYEKAKGDMTVIVDADETAIGEQDKKVDSIKAQIMDKEQELALAQTPEDETKIQGEIDTLKTEQSTAQENLTKLEENRSQNIENLRTLKKNFNRENTMLEKLEADWQKTADRTDKKFDEMGEKIISLGDSEVGSIVQGINVEHDGSLGLTMTGSVDALPKLLEGVVDAEQLEAMKATDNPAPTLRAVAAKIAAMEAEKQKTA